MFGRGKQHCLQYRNSSPWMTLARQLCRECELALCCYITAQLLPRQPAKLLALRKTIQLALLVMIFLGISATWSKQDLSASPWGAQWFKSTQSICMRPEKWVHGALIWNAALEMWTSELLVKLFSSFKLEDCSFPLLYECTSEKRTAGASTAAVWTTQKAFNRDHM